VHEGGIRTQFVVHWPKRIKPGTASNALSAHIDVMPSLLAACEAEPPADVAFDGRNMLPWWIGQDKTPADRTIFIQSHRGDVPVRYHHFAARNQRWKLVHPSGFGRESFDGEPRFELFDQIWLSEALAEHHEGSFIDRRTRHGGDGTDHDPAWVVLDL